jgi:hypothetical protein
VPRGEKDSPFLRSDKAVSTGPMILSRSSTHFLFILARLVQSTTTVYATTTTYALAAIPTSPTTTAQTDRDSNTMDLILQKPDATLEGLSVEIMSLIIEEVGPAVIDSTSKLLCESVFSQDDFVLDAYDVSTLRLASCRLESTTLDAFTRRFFTTRQHMLSKASVLFLFRIALSPKFSFAVQEVAIGPERVNSRLKMWMSAVRRQYADNWKCEAQDDWQALVGEQRMFDESEEADTMLKNAFKGFKNLKHVHIDAYTQKNVYTDWNKA